MAEEAVVTQPTSSNSKSEQQSQLLFVDCDCLLKAIAVLQSVACLLLLVCLLFGCWLTLCLGVPLLAHTSRHQKSVSLDSAA